MQLNVFSFDNKCLSSYQMHKTKLIFRVRNHFVMFFRSSCNDVLWNVSHVLSNDRYHFCPKNRSDKCWLSNDDPATLTARRDLSKKRLNDFNEHYKNISETVYFCHSLFFFGLKKDIYRKQKHTTETRIAESIPAIGPLPRATRDICHRSLCLPISERCPAITKLKKR